MDTRGLLLGLQRFSPPFVARGGGAECDAVSLEPAGEPARAGAEGRVAELAREAQRPLLDVAARDALLPAVRLVPAARAEVKVVHFEHICAEV